MKKIPVLLVTAAGSRALESLLKNHDDFLLLETIRLNDTEKVATQKNKYYDLLVLIDIIGLEIRPVVITSLILRNRGEQVFITCSDDFGDLCEVTKDIHKFIAEESPKGLIRTEIIITNHALSLLGDINPIIKEFERDYLNLP